jgi:hypothetical protein
MKVLPIRTNFLSGREYIIAIHHQRRKALLFAAKMWRIPNILFFADTITLIVLYCAYY